MTESATLHRVRLSLQGLLQGVGFRPFVYQLAHEIGLKGWVQNSPQGVSIEAEGSREALDEFMVRLEKERPSNAVFQNMESSCLEPLGYDGFSIRDSENSGDQSTLVLPDIATCHECLKEIFDPSNRRYLYPFTNCTHCGPRFSIIETLPYDRQNTSMKQFQMCGICQGEYENPRDRRFHAQPNACHDCGPHLEFWDARGSCLSKMEGALKRTVNALREGAVVGVKGIGGFHLMVNACDDQAVLRLRSRKHREEKPFALMFPDLSSVKSACELFPLEEQILLSPEAPIVLLQRKRGTDHLGDGAMMSREVAPSNPFLGVMLPSTPLHQILMGKLGFPVVATSGNISDETICFQENEVVIRLEGIADFFLVHNRPIVRHVDDSIVRVVLDSEQVLRRARGYAPLPITVNKTIPPLLGVGGYLKNTVAVAKGRNIFMSQHIGDLGNTQSASAFEDILDSMAKLYNIPASRLACDFHPDYPSTHWAEKNHEINIPVQHHVAHVFSCMAEHDLEGPLLGIAWDGSGYGLDGTVWGGEFFHVTLEQLQRIACWQPFPLLGGDAAVNEPRRSALGLLYQVLGETVFERPEMLKSFSSEELSVFKTMLDKKINCPMTSSCGRLFDAVASMVGVRQTNSFEGQSAMELEFLTQGSSSESFYPVGLIESDFGGSTLRRNESFHAGYDLNLRYQLDETPMVQDMLIDISEKRSPNLISTKFHNALTASIVAIAKRVGEERVVLSGGCFQNKYLTEQTVHRLHREGFRPYWHQRIPPNDGGLALGQIFAASWFEKRKGVSNVLSDTR
jgi:hydrogenase maturation protein HypF